MKKWNMLSISKSAQMTHIFFWYDAMENNLKKKDTKAINQINLG